MLSVPLCYCFSGECVASLSVVDPVLTERLEVIEPESFVMDFKKSTAANSKDGATTT